MDRNGTRRWLCPPALAMALGLLAGAHDDARIGGAQRGALRAQPPQSVAGPSEPSPCSEPGNLLCDGASGDCGAAQAEPGCGDACCCAAVCNAQPLCCIASWGPGCASMAINLGCAVAPLCQPAGNCQAYGDLAASSSELGVYLSADDFSPAANGAITSICWEGAYAPGPGTDSFRVRYFADDGGLPGALLAQFSQAAATLPGLTRIDTRRLIVGTSTQIFRYSATHAPLPVTAGTCYWIEISNTLPGAQDWFWSWAEEGRNQDQPAETRPREGNGRSLLDGSPPDGYDAGDLTGSVDLAFCLGVALQAPACGFQTLFDTGPHEATVFNGNTGQHVGWSSGNLNNGDQAQRRTAQPFSLPPLPPGSGAGAWMIEQLIVEAFQPVGAANQFYNVEIFSRTALDAAPTPAQSLHQFFGVPFNAANDVDPVTEEIILLLPPGDLTLPPGDYWLTIFGTNTIVPFQPSNIAWFTNAPDGINNSCTLSMPPPGPGSAGCQPSPGGAPPGAPAMLRAGTYPSPGFGAYTLTASVLTIDPANDPTPDPDDLYNAAMRFRGQVAASGAPFQPPLEFLAADEPIVHVVADLDGNGTMDTAVVIPADVPQVAGRMQVFRNLGDFQGQWLGLLANPPVNVGHEPSAVAAGLFNNDAHVDLVITNAGDDNVSIFLNQGLGTGTFALFTQVPVGDRPSAVVAGDFNEDTFTDLAVTNENDNNLMILLGNGTGNFAPALGAAPINIGTRPVAILNGDFDGNKCPDLAGGGQSLALGAGAGHAFVLLGQHGGGFLGPFFFGVGVDPTDVASDDLDGDGLNDLVAANNGDNTLSVLFNLGSGNFAPAVSVPVGAHPRSVETFNLDNALDPELAVVSEVGGVRAVQVLQKPPAGPFAVTFAVNVGADANFVVEGLFNGDALEDLATVNADDGPTGGSVTVLLTAPPPAAACPWDCANLHDGMVGVADFLALLAQWGQVGPSCDFDGNGAGTADLLAMLAHWGPCP